MFGRRRARAVPRPTGAWRALPPIARVVGSVRTSGRMLERSDPKSLLAIAQPLRHSVGGPAGTAGIATAAPRSRARFIDRVVPALRLLMRRSAREAEQAPDVSDVGMTPIETGLLAVEKGHPSTRITSKRRNVVTQRVERAHRPAQPIHAHETHREHESVGAQRDATQLEQAATPDVPDAIKKQDASDAEHASRHAQASGISEQPDKDAPRGNPAPIQRATSGWVSPDARIHEQRAVSSERGIAQGLMRTVKDPRTAKNVAQHRPSQPASLSMRAVPPTAQPSSSSQPATPPPPTRTAPLVGARALTRIPVAARAAAEHATGTDLRDVMMHRGDDVGRAADRMDAHAFATGGNVFIPPKHGSVETGEGAGLLAHELVHAAQQRRYGTLPPESSPMGRAFEAEARAAELKATNLPAALPQIPDPAQFYTATNTSIPHVQRAPNGSGPGDAREQSLTDVMDQVYEAVRGRLRDELRIDRERSGRLTELP